MVCLRVFGSTSGGTKSSVCVIFVFLGVMKPKRGQGRGGLRRESVEFWSLELRRLLFVWELDILNNLLGMLEGFVGLVDGDSWLWKPEGSGVSIVKSCYLLVEKMCLLDDGGRESEKAAFRYL